MSLARPFHALIHYTVWKERLSIWVNVVTDVAELFRMFFLVPIDKHCCRPVVTCLKNNSSVRLMSVYWTTGTMSIRTKINNEEIN